MMEFIKDGIIFGLGLSALMFVWLIAFAIFKGIVNLIEGGGSDEQ